MLARLLKANVKIDQENQCSENTREYGKTAVMHAASMNNLSNAKFLMSKGAKLDHTLGKKLFDYCEYSDVHEELQAYLKKMQDVPPLK